MLWILVNAGVQHQLQSLMSINPLGIIPDCVRDLCLWGPSLYLESNYWKAAVARALSSQRNPSSDVFGSRLPFDWCWRMRALSLGKRSTFPDGVLASRTPSHYRAAYPQPAPVPRTSALFSLSLSFFHASKLCSRRLCLGWGARPRSDRGRRHIFDEISIPSFDNTLLLYR